MNSAPQNPSIPSTFRTSAESPGPPKATSPEANMKPPPGARRAQTLSGNPGDDLPHTPTLRPTPPVSLLLPGRSRSQRLASDIRRTSWMRQNDCAPTTRSIIRKNLCIQRHKPLPGEAMQFWLERSPFEVAEGVGTSARIGSAEALHAAGQKDFASALAECISHQWFA